jgi:hypothetical protein
MSAQADSGAILITDPSQRDAAAGKLVTVVGIQTRTRAVTVNGVDVDGDYDLSDRRVRATGTLHKRVVEPRKQSEPIVASRGPGTYYYLVNANGNGLAKTVLDE